MPSNNAARPLSAQPTPVAEGVWIVDGAPINAAGLPLPVRMTVIRLSSGELLLHSPIRYTADLRQALEAIGPIRQLVAPSIAHWMFLRDWQQACPDARTWAVPGLRDRAQVRAAGLRVDQDLGDRAPAPWADDMDQVLVRGPVFAEADFFHRPSRTLLLTDLVLNLEPQGLPALARTMAGLLGILAPDGKAPLYLRLLLGLNRAQAKQAADRLLAFEPERVVFTHGRWFDRDATSQLRRSLAWLTGAKARPSAAYTVAAVAIAGSIGLAAALMLTAVMNARRRRS